MQDRFGRAIEYLRLSITERCTLRCAYCRAQEGDCPKERELSTEEFVRIVRAMAKLGVNKIRVTGGEPLLRRDVVTLVERFGQVPGIKEIALTTNAQQLYDLVRPLKSAGLTRLNISMDSLNEEKYRSITGGGELAPVLKAIDRCIEEELLPLKVNMVVMRGVNDDEVDALIELAKSRPIDVRFIELMPIGALGQNPKLRVPSDELIKARPRLVPIPPRYQGQPSRDYKIEGYVGRIGFISPISHQFCGECNRVRVMSDGMLRPCLGDNGEISLKAALAEGDDALLKTIEDAIYQKPEGHCFSAPFVSAKNMSKIGG
ncbi:MAG: GTP 3',8-cyclase MoaA [Bacillota bacterium]